MSTLFRGSRLAETTRALCALGAHAARTSAPPDAPRPRAAGRLGRNERGPTPAAADGQRPDRHRPLRVDSARSAGAVAPDRADTTDTCFTNAPGRAAGGAARRGPYSTGAGNDRDAPDAADLHPGRSASERGRLRRLEQVREHHQQHLLADETPPRRLAPCPSARHCPTSSRASRRSPSPAHRRRSGRAAASGRRGTERSPRHRARNPAFGCRRRPTGPVRPRAAGRRPALRCRDAATAAGLVAGSRARPPSGHDRDRGRGRPRRRNPQRRPPPLTERSGRSGIEPAEPIVLPLRIACERPSNTEEP
jgi:hypothetical protein